MGRACLTGCALCRLSFVVFGCEMDRASQQARTDRYRDIGAKGAPPPFFFEIN